MGFWPTWFRLPLSSTSRHILLGVVIGLSLSLSSTSLIFYSQKRKKDRLEKSFDQRPIELRSDEIVNGVTGLIGNTPLVRINSLSDALGVEILGKAEFLNPGGSVKDRVALRIVEDAERLGLLHPHTGSRIFEGTVGSTGISIATIAKARGYDATIIMPDDVAEEKVKALRSLGAEVEQVRPASIVDKKQFVNLARDRAAHFGHTANPRDSLIRSSSSVLVTTTASEAVLHEHGTLTKEEADELENKPRGFFADQFENRSNYQAHFEGTGPEIWRQTSGRVDAFVSGAGTGGTLSGTGQYLKSVNEDLMIILSDPEGSGLYNKVKYGVMYDRKEAEGTKRRHQVDTVVEGIGINRLTHNMELGLDIIDDAFRITDAEAVAMSRYLVENDGLFLGSSSACNLVACIKFIKSVGWNDGQRVVTILCDSGTRHYSKFWNDEYLQRANIPVDKQIIYDLLSQ
ncbi:PALP-domain-containing protein [Cristinia sonorae]|uniref:cysteine synthase n=1 Tax=Cristinia sonorae TaxID=1940300 RepID=A0A8K0UY53_9AGAR|nr:PALP-domain-containing protein [Cristinia sonorae]